jgi:hypothetical protein
MNGSEIVYRVSKKTGFYGEICNLLVVLQGVALSTAYLLDEQADFAPGDYITVVAKHLDAKVRLPLHGPIEASILGREPDYIDITIVANKDEERSYSHTVKGLRRFVDVIFKLFIVGYHEAYKPEIERRYPAGRDQWPNAWQMSWAVRNAVCHSGSVFKNSKSESPKMVSWRGIEHRLEDDEHTPILSRLNGGDLLILLTEMEDARTALPLQV